MPLVLETEGVQFRLFFNDHNPPHVHVFFQQQEVILQLRDGAILEGGFPRGKSKLIKRLFAEHQAVLVANWNELNPANPL